MIVVTGGSGKAGRACISELVAHGYELCNIDLVSGSDPTIPFSQVDLTDFGQTMAALSAIDERVHNVTGIVHLAAIPAPGRSPVPAWRSRSDSARPRDGLLWAQGASAP